MQHSAGEPHGKHGVGKLQEENIQCVLGLSMIIVHSSLEAMLCFVPSIVQI